MDAGPHGSPDWPWAGELAGAYRRLAAIGT